MHGFSIAEKILFVKFYDRFNSTPLLENDDCHLLIFTKKLPFGRVIHHYFERKEKVRINI